ncbi:MAG: hypothetical protein M1351_02765 [Candidatus Thermoplasmatota archaeon]|nr:hypothetical protein [Candidatus Thermoplasmatota archaeon]
MKLISISYLSDQERSHRLRFGMRYTEHFNYECPAGHRTSRPPYVLSRKE